MGNADSFEHGDEIAVIGMAGRFPGARNVEEFWANLRDGVESITFFTDEELRERGVSEALLRNPHYVKAAGVLEEIDGFDAAFFGFSPKEAAITDPQHRLFLECAWEALEAAGYVSESARARVGVYAGASLSTYLFNLYAHQDELRAVGDFRAMLGNDKDHLPTWVSYKLDLKGASMAVQTACSSSLVAVHAACQSLLSGENDVALAGGVTVRVPHRGGYLYQPGGINSPDGHCRAFDADARGTLSGNGVGVVVLKLLGRALADGDTVHAVIKGSAVNNDGSLKAAYTAPSVEGQARVIAEAQALAGVGPEGISYVEAHGTGTEIGDPIEVAALTQVFRARTAKKNFCGVGSVKTNIGHLDAAAGVVGLIKTVLALKHRLLPPSLHFNSANPHLKLEESPFYVNHTLSEWKAGDAPRRAGVSSFGMGGTNAHVILEESPAPELTEESRRGQLLVISARTPAALDAATAGLAEHLKRDFSWNLADVAYTLQVGRRAFAHRRVVVCRDREEALKSLESPAAKNVLTAAHEPGHRPLVFMFPGQGAQRVNMARDLYEVEPLLREEVDLCADLLRPHLQLDLRELLFPAEGDAASAAHRLNQTSAAQPALFVVEYALARLWMKWGLRPEAMIGHSLGEYVAACLAGVFSLEDALALVAARGLLMQRVPEGGMLAVPLPAAEVEPLLAGGLAIAAVNAPSLCVVSGPERSLAEFEARVGAAQGCRRLATSHAFHSPMMEPALRPFVARVSQVELHAPKIPYVSNVTGTWISGEEATDPRYWANHLLKPVRFAEGVATLAKEPNAILLEVGPGQTLRALAARNLAPSAARVALSTLGDPRKGESDESAVLTALGRLWLAGVRVDWEAVHQGERRRRIPLPTYPFERKKHWIGGAKQSAPPEQQTPPAARQADPSESTPQGQAPSAATREDIPHMTPERETVTPSFPRREKVLAILKTLVGELTGVEEAEIAADESFIDLGVDSLLLVQASQLLQERFGLEIPFRVLYDELSTLNALCSYLEQELPAEFFAEPAPAPAPQATPAPEAVEADTPGVAATPAAAAQPAAHVAAASAQVTASARDSALERILAQQIQVTSQLLDVLRSRPSAPAAAPANGTHAAPPPAEAAAAPATAAARVAKPLGRAPSEGTKSDAEPFVPFRPLEVGAQGGLSPRQQKYLSEFTARYNERTRESKRRTQLYRRALADPRAALGFRLRWKELVYQIIGERSSGSRIWDVDGNEYVDLTMGFGVNLFGHGPAFVQEAVREQFELGVQLGPQSAEAGRAAELLCELTGMERAIFCNSGTEAVMAALRVARAVTGRGKVALFAGSYHGSFDGTLVRPAQGDGGPHGSPLSPGITPGMVSDLLVLEYGSPRSLELLKAHAHELAAVLVEPVQSRRLDLQPREFLHELRRLTSESGAALIFDEVITGFRIHPGGAQAWFGVEADLATYGKVVGGGMPVGVLAGRAAFMDAVDGGAWQFGDASYPRAGQTFYAGTFFKHPLTMAAAKAVLEHLKASGPALQAQLNERTAGLVARLNNYFREDDVPLRLTHFGSLFNLQAERRMRYLELFNYHLIDKGVFVWEGATRFLSTAHAEADLDFVVGAVKQSVAELREADFIPAPGASDGQGRPATRAADSPRSPEKVPAADAEADAARRGGEVAGRAALTLPATDRQRQLWFLTQVEESASQAYNESISLHLRGPLRPEQMRRALQQLVDRHDALRTTFSPDGGLQNIAPALRLAVPLDDFSGLAGEERGRAAAEQIASEAGRAFDLVGGPLLRARLLKLEASHHVLVLTIHHIIVDGWSLGVMLRELGALYAAECEGVAARLAEPLQYSEYARLLAERKQDESQGRDVQYWVEQFAGGVPVLELPTDRPRPPVQTYAGALEFGVVDGPVYDELKRLSRRQGSTLFLTLFAVYNVLLHRLSGQDDIVVSTLAAGQAQVGGKDLVGYCINALPLRSRLAPAQTFGEYLAALKRSFFDAYEHQNCSMGRLVKELNIPRGLGRSPLMSAVFNLDRSGSGLKFHDLDVEIETNSNGRAKFELYLNVIDTGDGLKLECEYNTDLFDGRTIRRWLANFRTLLEGVVAAPDGRAALLPLLPAGERRQLLHDWNGTASPVPPDSDINRLFERQVRLTPDAVAVVHGNRRLTYAELGARVSALARRLRGLGVGPEVKVGLCLERTPEMLAAMLAVFKAGGAYVPLDPQYPRERLSYIMEQTQSPVLLTQRHLRDRVPAARAQVVCLDTDRAERPAHDTNAQSPGYASPAESATLNPANLAYVIYTSGSTGRPKGVAVTHHSLTVFLHWALSAFSREELSGVLASTSICFDLSVFELFAPLACGGKVVLADNALELPVLPAAGEVTLVNTVPSAMRELLRLGALPASVGTVNLAGEALPRTLVDALYVLPQVEAVYNLYGPSEDTTYSTWALVERGGAGVTVGRPVANTRAYILDAELQPVALGVAGQLYLAGSGLARGYLGRPDLTAERFLPDPFGAAGGRMYRTGDVCRYLPDGQIEYLGREDQQVKVRGYRIEPGEIETALRGHAGVEEACVVCVADEGGEGGARLVGYLVAKGGEALGAAELRGWLGSRVPEYMIPSAFVLLERLPLTPNGKVDRKALPAPGAARLGAGAEYVEARAGAESALAAIWADVLGVERVGVHDNFFELGGDSILSIQIVTRARAAGLKITPRHLFQHPTVAGLASVAEAASEGVAEQGVVTGPVPLTPVQQWFFEHTTVERHHWNQAILLRVPEGLNAAALEAVTRHLLEHHDALRLRFLPGPNGFEQFNAGVTDGVPFKLVDLSGVPAAEQPAAIEREAEALQQSLDLTEGPLARVALFDLGAGRPGRLFIAVHHLAVDGVSWRILLEDLQSAYEQLSEGRAVQLPPKTSSFKQWAEALKAHAPGAEVQSELGYWLDGRRRDAAPLPVDYAGGVNDAASAQTVSLSLDGEETELLLKEVPKLYHTQINDVLLTALAQTLSAWAGGGSLLVDLEGHGREEVSADLDVSRTVGWFTSLYPVLLEVEAGAEPESALKSVRGQLRGVPGRGLGYGLLRYLGDAGQRARLAALPRAEVVFNYLGQFDQVMSAESGFRLAPESCGAQRSPRGQRSHLLEINGSVMGGRLQLNWTFSANVHRRSTVEELAENFMGALRALGAGRPARGAAALMPSDFPLAGLNQQQLDRVMQLLGGGEV